MMGDSGEQQRAEARQRAVDERREYLANTNPPVPEPPKPIKAAVWVVACVILALVTALIGLVLIWGIVSVWRWIKQ